MKSDILLVLAILPAVPLVVLAAYALRNKDRIALLIAVLWAMALTVGSFLGQRDTATIIASPLVVLVVWYIVREKQS